MRYPSCNGAVHPDTQVEIINAREKDVSVREMRYETQKEELNRLQAELDSQRARFEEEHKRSTAALESERTMFLSRMDEDQRALNTRIQARHLTTMHFADPGHRQLRGGFSYYVIS